MIAKLTGLLDSTGDGLAVIDVSGVGYLVFCSARTLDKLPGAGERVSVHVDTHVREDHIHLYGFADPAERDWFRLLLTVQGVGARLALGILSALGPEQIVQAVVAQDRASLTSAPGVGPKLAARMLTELKDKAGELAVVRPVDFRAGAPEAGPVQDAVSALVNLGYRPTEAFGAVSQAAQQLGREAAVESLIKAGLQELSA